MKKPDSAAKAPKTLRLSEYKKPDFTTDHVDLMFDIQDRSTIVTSTTTYRRTKPVSTYPVASRNHQSVSDDLEKNGMGFLYLNIENPNLDSEFLMALEVNGTLFEEGKDYFYFPENNEVLIPVPAHTNEITVRAITNLQPQHNSKLSGLYQSDECVITQCETEGFRRITPFLDRPDVLATYSVTVKGNQEKAPVLLSNGNKAKELKNPLSGRHEVTFNDPLPKPSYLFALAAGNFDYVEDEYEYKSGHKVTVRVYVEPGKADRATHALKSIKDSMQWDEDTFGREYELDTFSVVAVSKFTFGAMENTSLNIFRDALVLALPETATDDNYQRIADVIGHEFFHHWSGNQVTLANWFNLSLKEGLTVLREQMFTAHLTSEAWERVRSVKELRSRQFREDDSPLAMPVMPAELQAVENIYNGTTYDKGAEILRMMATLMGRETFIEGVRDYFDTYKGQAVTINHFIDKMEKASGLNLSGQFKLWYTQSGRPRVKAEGVYDAKSQTYSLTLKQDVPPTRDQAVKQPMYIPVKMGLVAKDGQDIPLILDSDDSATQDSGQTERTLHLTCKEQTFTFTGIDQEPAFHSLFRDMSAPVSVDTGLSSDQLLQQLRRDPNGFNRWDAGQQLALGEMKRLYSAYAKTGAMPDVNRLYLETLKTVASIATHPTVKFDAALLAQTLTLPGVDELESAIGEPAKPAAIAAVIKQINQSVSDELMATSQFIFNNMSDGLPYSFDYEATSRRALKRVAVDNMLANSHAQYKPYRNAAAAMYASADNMTDKMTALSALNDYIGDPLRETAMQDFYNRHKDDSLVIQKWFYLQGAANAGSVIENIRDISQSAVFDWTNPGHAQSLYGGFLSNYGQFHRTDGKGYELLADAIIKLDKINGATAARFVNALSSWRDYAEPNRGLIITQLERLASVDDLTANVKEKVLKALPETGPDAGAKAAPSPTAPEPN